MNVLTYLMVNKS